MSYQFGHNTIAGWNDCPSELSNSSLSSSSSSLVESKKQKRRRPVYVGSPISSPATSQPVSRTASSTSVKRLPPLPAAIKNKIRLRLESIIPETSPARPSVEMMLGDDSRVKAVQQILTYFDNKEPIPVNTDLPSELQEILVSHLKLDSGSG